MVKRSLQYIFPIIAMLLIVGNLHASSLETEHSAIGSYRIAPKLVIDLSEISADSLFSGRQIHASLLEHKQPSNSSLFNFTGAPQFTLDFANINLLKLNASNRLIRYIRSDSGANSISIVDQNRIDSAKSIIVHGNFIGIGMNEKSRHFILGKDKSDGEVRYSAKWGYRF